MSRKTGTRKQFPAGRSVICAALTLGLLQAPLYGSTAFAAAASADTVAVEEGTVSGGKGQTNNDESGAKITKEQAVERTIRLFPELKDARMERVEFGNGNMFPPLNEKIWTIHWVIESGNHSMGFSTQLDAITGDLIQYYNHFEEESQVYYPPKVTREAARDIAKKFIAAAAPSLAVEQLKEEPSYNMTGRTPLFGPVQYHFYFNVTVNGITASNSFVMLSVDGNGKIVSYNGRRSQEEYPSADTVLTKQEAEQKLKDALKLSLAYIPDYGKTYYDPANVKTYRLGYVWNDISSAIFIDAKTGKFVDNEGDEAIGGPAAYSTFEPIGTPFAENKGKQLSEEQALEIVKKYASIPADYDRASATLAQNWRNVKRNVWELRWSQNMGMGLYPSDISASVDADSGQLLEFNTYDIYYGNEDEEPVKPEPSITEQQARGKAIEAVTALYPNASKNFRLLEHKIKVENPGKTAYRFIFQLFYDNIRVQDQAVMVNLDGDGKLVNYSTPYMGVSDVEKKLAGLKATVSQEAALLTYQNALTMELRYMDFGGYFADGGHNKTETKLIYLPVLGDNHSSYFVNASTGELVSNNFINQTGTGAVGPVDISKHWASGQLAVMVEHGVLVPDENGLVRPNENLTLGSWMNMFYRGFTPDGGFYYGENRSQFADVPVDSEYAAAVGFFVNRGWMDANPSGKLNPGKTLTRGELAEQLTSILNYEKLAAYMNQDKDIATLKDAAAIKNKGAAAVAVKLGLLTTSGGKFNPNAPVTKAQASVIMLRLITLQGKVDTPIM
jgi:Zn-dependent metalloprotease